MRRKSIINKISKPINPYSSPIIEAMKSECEFGSIPHRALEVPGPKPNKPPELIAILL